MESGVSAQESTMFLRTLEASAKKIISCIFEFATSVNTRVTSRKLTRHGCERHQYQIGSPILCDRKHNKINAQRIHHTVSKRLEPNGTDVASNDSYSRLLQLAGGARLFALDP
jgi:hypothetical protein